MVRTKAKKQKGDDAFQTKKQKVGRKKLAPATATRAEVHARTLRLSTSSALAHAPTAPPPPPSTAIGSLEHPNDSKRRRKEESAKSREDATMAQHSFPELLAASRHYKSANRASAFSAIAKALGQQVLREMAAASDAAHDRFAGFVALPTMLSQQHGAGSSTSSAGAKNASITPLERLKAYTAALEAITDTDDDVRQAALGCLRIIVSNQWLSATVGEGQGSLGVVGGRGGSRSGWQSRATPAGAALSSAPFTPLADLEEAWAAAAAANQTGSGVGFSFTSYHTASVGTSLSGGVRHAEVAEHDRMKAALQAIHIAFTHAMKGVRMSGVELLGLVLANARPGALTLAARAVSRQQRAYLSSSGGGGDAQERAVNETRAEEAWMVSLLKRLSQLVLRTKELYVLPWLLSSFLSPSASITTTASSAAGAPAVVGTGVVEKGLNPTVWHNPDLIADFFSEVLPQWSNTWKELMDLQLGLLRQEEKLKMAVSLARAFAIILNYLKREQMNRNVSERQKLVVAQQRQEKSEEGSDQQRQETKERAAGHLTTASRLLSKAKQQTVKELFIHKVPVTIEEILNHSGGSRVAGGIGQSHSTRAEFGLALAQVCTPLAGTDEGWAVLSRFFSTVLSPNNEDAVSSIALLHAFTVYLSILRLFPKHLNAAGILLRNQAKPRTSSEAKKGSDGVSTLPLSSLSPGALWAAENVSAGGSFAENSSGNSVFEKLIPFAPSMIQAVVRHLTQYAQLKQTTVAASSAVPSSSHAVTLEAATATAARERDVAVVVHLLLSTSELVSLLVQYPMSIPGGGDGRGGETATAVKNRQSIADVLFLVPRLLFSLRPQKPLELRVRSASAVSQRKHLRDGTPALPVRDSADGDETTAVTLVNPTLLAEHPLLVDMIVRRLLQSLWLIASSGHPLLLPASTTAATPSASAASTPRKSPRDALCGVLQPLFGFSLTPANQPVAGVLSRCSAATVALAQETLFYFGVLDSASMCVIHEEHEGEKSEGGENTSVAAGRKTAGSAVAVPQFSLEDVLLMMW